MLNFSKSIRPSAYLGIYYREISLLKGNAHLLKVLADSEEDVQAGRSAPIQETFDSIRKILTNG